MGHGEESRGELSTVLVVGTADDRYTLRLQDGRKCTKKEEKADWDALLSE